MKRLKQCFSIIFAAALAFPLLSTPSLAAAKSGADFFESVKYSLSIDGKSESLWALRIGDGVTNKDYFKLRDLGAVLNGTEKQFGISWDGGKNSVTLTAGAPYTPVGGELEALAGYSEPYLPETVFYIGGRQVPLGDGSVETTSNAGGSTDQAFNLFEWDAADKGIRYVRLKDALKQNDGNFNINYYDADNNLFYTESRDNATGGWTKTTYRYQDGTLIKEPVSEPASAFTDRWNNIIKNIGMSAQESEAWLDRLQKDIHGLTEDYRVGGIDAEDLDSNGTQDLMVLLQSVFNTGMTDQNPAAYLCVYMNDSPVYTIKYNGVITAFGFMQAPIYGDIDNDGCPEIVYDVLTGGNGGAGSSVKGVLKYRDDTLTKMELPGDGSDDFIKNNDVGYMVKVLLGSEENEYKAVCESLGKTVTFNAPNAVDENGNKLLTRITENKEVGANDRGYARFSVISRNGRNYLQANEYLFGEGGVSQGIGWANFLLDWDKDGNPSVLDFGVSKNAFEG